MGDSNYNDLERVNERELEKIHSKFRQANLNYLKSEWNQTKKYIRKGLRDGTITVKAKNISKPKEKQLKLG